MELVWDVYFAVLKMDGGSWTNILVYTCTERLFGGAMMMKKTDKTLFLVRRFSKATPSVVFVSIFFYGLARFVVFSYPVR